MLWFVFRANTPEEQTLFQFGWFIVGLLTQTVIVHMACTPKIPFIQSRAAPPLLVMTAVIMGFGVFLPMGPLAHYFKLQALPPLYFNVSAADLAGLHGADSGHEWHRSAPLRLAMGGLHG